MAHRQQKPRNPQPTFQPEAREDADTGWCPQLPALEAGSPEMWNQVLKNPERTPTLGFYDQSNPEVADWGNEMGGRARYQLFCLLLVSGQ